MAAKEKNNIKLKVDWEKYNIAYILPNALKQNLLWYNTDNNQKININHTSAMTNQYKKQPC